jgi:hypothetical protein
MFVQGSKFSDCRNEDWKGHWILIWGEYRTLREEHRLRVSDNRVLKRIFKPEREEVEGGWRRLFNEVLHELYASPS